MSARALARHEVGIRTLDSLLHDVELRARGAKRHDPDQAKDIEADAEAIRRVRALIEQFGADHP